MAKTLARASTAIVNFKRVVLILGVLRENALFVNLRIKPCYC
jgi:hypothetical protein